MELRGSNQAGAATCLRAGGLWNVRIHRLGFGPLLPTRPGGARHAACSDGYAGGAWAAEAGFATGPYACADSCPRVVGFLPKALVRGPDGLLGRS